jgi:methionyl aminopeptidase
MGQAPIRYYKPEEIEKIKVSARIVSRTLAVVAEHIKEGITTAYLDKIAETYIRDQGASPAFKGYRGFPATLCTSVNHQVVHGIPNDKPLINGDVVSVDCGVLFEGYHGDHAYTFAIGEVHPETLRLLKVTKECLYLGAAQARAGNRIGDIAFAIQQHAHANKFSIVRQLVGHGVGKHLHEEPDVPNYGKKGKGVMLKDGMVLAIEPMINAGVKEIKQLQDNWTIITADGKPSAHFEHNVAIVKGKPEILSTFEYVEEALAKNQHLTPIEM